MFRPRWGQRSTLGADLESLAGIILSISELSTYQRLHEVKSSLGPPDLCLTPMAFGIGLAIALRIRRTQAWAAVVQSGSYDKISSWGSR
jgi:hypothetical protein